MRKFDLDEAERALVALNSPNGLVYYKSDTIMDLVDRIRELEAEVGRLRTIVAGLTQSCDSLEKDKEYNASLVAEKDALLDSIDEVLGAECECAASVNKLRGRLT